MRKCSEKVIEVKLSKRIVAAVMVFSYICTTSPVYLFAEKAKSFSKAAGSSSVNEEKSEVLISAKDGGTVTLGDASIEIPEGALKEDTKISITRLYKVEDTGESLYNAIPKSGGYRFLPAGTKFEKEVVITLPYNAELNSKPHSLDELYTYFYDTQKKSWIKLERLEVDKELHKVRSLSTHFTDMINATLTMPESASPVDVNLNSIKNLEAAKPDGHLIKFNPPKASSTGDASFSFELGIPAGRRGMQPQISVSYSSGGGNGIMGKGFDVSYGSSVTTDTRLGLPDYDTRDAYMLDGILLSEKTRNGTEVTYTPQKEASFSRIVRYNAGTDGDCWEVTDKNGTKRIYAQNSSSCTGSGKRTFTWNLTRTEDVHGNSVVYEYEKQDGYVYPAAIYYTGFGAAKGNYNVKFHYDENGDRRQDIRIDARSREIISCKRLLTGITTHYRDGGSVREYRFSYKEGLAKEKMLVSLAVRNNAGERYEYAFSYTEPEKDGSGNVLYFADAEEWSNGKPIKTGNSTSIGANFNTGTAGGYGLRIVDVRAGGSVSGSVSTGENYTEDSMADINGDGRPDAISQEGNTLTVYLNNGSGFDSGRKIRIAKGRFSSELDHEDTSSSSFGWNAYTGAGLKSTTVSASLGTGYSEVYQKSSSSTKCSFIDMDRDGFVDIVETGKSTYLKNKGNLVFEETPLYSSVTVSDVQQKISEEDAEEYRKTYLVQTPFRMWKAPYEGILSIRETASAMDSSYAPEKNTVIQTFVGSGGSDKELEREVKKTGTVSAAKESLEIAGGTNIYFVSDNGKEPLNSDITWNIDIAYSKVKLFKTNWPHPFFNFDRLSEGKTYSYKSSSLSECRTKAREEFVRSVIGTEILLQLYDENAAQNSSGGTCTVSFTYNPGWKNGMTESQIEEIYTVLAGNGYIYPAVFTSAQFDEYLASITAAAAGQKDEQYYSVFAGQFVRHVTQNLYVMKGFESNELIQEFFAAYPMSGSLALRALENYTVSGIPLNIQKKEASYDSALNFQAQDNFRSDRTAGTVFRLDGSGHRAVIIGSFRGNPLAYDFEENTLLEKKEDGLADADFKYEASSEGDTVSIGINRDSAGILESTVTVSLGSLSYKAGTLSEPEMETVIDDIPVACTDPHDGHWNRTEQNPVKENETGILFSSMTLSPEQQSALIDALYQKKDKYKDAAENEETQEYEYSYYILKESPDYEAAGKILHEYKKSKVLTELFPFYKKSGDIYVLDESRIDSEEKERLLESECAKFHFGKYASVRTEQHFETEHLYDVQPEGEYSILTVDDGFVFSKKTGRLPKVRWNSSEDFSSPESLEAADAGMQKTVYEYMEKDTVNGEAVEEEAAVTVGNDEFLYGGSSGWFYGIWKGALCDVPFSEDALKGFKKEISSQDEFDAEEERIKNTKPDESTKQNASEDAVRFYLPKTGVRTAQDCGLESVKNDSVSYSADYSRSLCGTVAVYSEVVRSGSTKTVRETRCMPFVSGNTIHADRSGGVSYYKVEGLYAPAPSGVSGGGAFTMPSLSRSFTEGKDKTPNISAGIGGSVSKSIGDAEEQIKTVKTGSLDMSFSEGRNKSSTNVEQSVQDIDGNGIPDILQISGGGIRVTKGGIADGAVHYSSSAVFSGAGTLSRNSTDVNVSGGSASASGNVSVYSTKGGKTTLIQQTPSPTPSGGMTVTSGTSVQTRGLADLNGDGLSDYYDGSALRLNNGSGFVSCGDAFVFSSPLTESESRSAGSNFSIGKSYGGTEVNSIKSSASLTLGGSYSASSSNTKKMLLDLNGDGLQDIVEMNPGSPFVSVSYNTGSGFAPGGRAALQSWGRTVTESMQKFRTQGDSGGFDLGLVGEIPLVGSAAGKGLSESVENPYGKEAERLADSLEWNTGVTLGLSGSLGVNVNIGIDITIPTPTPVYCGTINMSFNAGEGANASTSINGISVRMADMDGDGLPDHVLRIPGTGTYWKRNISGRYGQLTEISLPQGGTVQIEYAEKYGTVDSPLFKHVMSRVTMHDGCGAELPEIPHGEHSVTTKYEYENAYYDRQKKDFYGFGTVTSTSADGTYSVEEYYNRDYYAKGCPRESRSYAKDGTLLTESRTELCGSPYALPAKEESRSYEKPSGTADFVFTSTAYEYDGYGSCTRVTQDFGGGERLTGEITYDNTDTARHIIGLPADIRVYDKDGRLLRHRSGSYDDLGQLTELRQYFDVYNYSVHTLKYDSYGNIKSVTDSRGATLAYTYDKDENMFVTGISQSGMGTDSYESKIDYDVPTQTKKSEADCNGNTLRYEYDSWQRITKIFTAYDTAIPAVSYEYQTPAANETGKHSLWHAVTNNKVIFDADDDSIIQTVLQIDGLGRAVRTAKTGFVNGVEGWNASGAVEYDEKGRVINEGMTEFIEGGLENLFNTTPIMTELFTSYEYDEKDRQIKTILPDGSAQANAFYIEENKLISETTDPLGNVSVQETDSRGNIVRVAKKDKDGKQLTEVTYKYNAIGEMLNAYDAKGHPITAEYDLLGRRTALESLDSGRQEFFYDEYSNLVRESSSVLRENNKQIVYEYDGLNRLVKIDYPDTEDTVYTYGGADDTHGAANRILSVTDASGTIEYEYGKLGEVIKETRTLATHLNGSKPTETAVMEYQSDYLGRMQHIVYPDGEKITYGYDNGGQVTSVTGENFGNTFEYVKDIGYDEYGQRVYIEYGNGVKTEYKYDSARRWLDTIKTENKWGQSYQNISYSFDAVGNVLGYENNCLDNVTGNYKTSQTYSYDNLYQLIRVEGETTYDPYRSSVPEFVSNYSQDFTFDELGLGNMTSKVSKESVRPLKKIGDNLNYNFEYIYDENYAHRLVRAGERYYKYDSNGNIICEQDGSFESNGTDTAYHKIEQETDDVYSTDYGWGLFKEDKTGSTTSRYRRTYTWNERNQLVSSVDANYSTAYVYGQDAQRSNKYTGNSETLYFNKMWTLHTDSGNSVYGGQSAKNIYLGETRIVTKLNSGNNPTYQEEYYKQYFYHSDHLGSASLVSDYKGDEYQRIEYTPYGETWVEKTSNTGLEFLPYKFTAKELDKETGLYYYGARYLDPKYSMWISADPALGEYIPKAPVNEEAKQHNQNLPGLGGVFNTVNLNLYHYAANNPIKYTDPDGQADFWGPFGGSSIKWAGAKIHRAVQDKLQSTYGGSIEQKIPGAGRADYVNGNEIYEVKPVTQYKDQNGKDQLQNYVDHLLGSEKGTSLLSSIPNDISIKNLEIINTGNLKVTCDVACITNTTDSNQSGMVYYIPYNWRTENKTNIATSAMIALTVFGSILASGASAAAETASAFADSAAAATFIIIPTPLLNQYMNRINSLDNDQI